MAEDALRLAKALPDGVAPNRVETVTITPATTYGFGELRPRRKVVSTAEVGSSSLPRPTNQV